MLVPAFFDPSVGRAQIAEKPLPEAWERIERVHLLAPGTGFINTRSRLLLTEDNGKSWSDRTPPIAGTHEILDVQFRDPQAGRLLFSTSERSILLGTTTDGGRHWAVSSVRSLSQNEWAGFSGSASLSFADDQHGWVMLRGVSSSNFSVGSLLATSDGGLTWNERPAPPAGDPVVFVTAADGWMAGGPAHTDMYVTRDGGRTWQATAIHAGGAFRYSLPRFADALLGSVLVQADAAGGATAYTYRTEDGGRSWQAAGFNVSHEGESTTLIASGGYSRLRTVAKAAYLGSEESLLEADFVNDRTGWLLAGSGACDRAGACYRRTRLVAVDEGEPVTDITPPDLRGRERHSGGLDMCSAPAIGQMPTWWTGSPEDSVNVYLGGVSAACSAPSADWISQARGMGWSLIPIWAGPQAPCSGFSHKLSASPSVAGSQGAGEANAASDAAASLGLTNTAVFYDMENYDVGDASCSAAVQAFVTGWVRQMHARGNLAGIYGAASVVPDWANAELPPDAIRRFAGIPIAGGGGETPIATRSVVDNPEGVIIGPARASIIGYSSSSGMENQAAAAAASGFKINVTYGGTVPAAAQTAFNSLVSTYQGLFNNNVTVNINVNFGNTGLGSSNTFLVSVPYSTWRAAVIANANANPGNSYAAAAAASLPANDPIGDGTVLVRTPNARALGLSANVASDSTLTFNSAAAFEYNGVAASGKFDFMDVAAHELDEALGIGSSLTGIANNTAIMSSSFEAEAEDYFRYSATNTRAITTNPAAFVYFSYNGGATNVARFNQDNTNFEDRNDWIYGNFGCPASPAYVQDGLVCSNQAVPVGSGPEVIVLNTLGYNTGPASAPATITSPANGSTLPGSSVTFQWTTGTGVTQYWLSISKAGVGGGELYNSDPGPGLVTSKTINGLPTDGSTIYVRLYSHIGATWPSVDYTYTAAGPATIFSPANGSTLPGASVTFQWTTGTGVTQYWLSVSKTGAGGGDLFNADPGPGLVTSRTISGLPTDGSTIYVRLYSHIGSTWPWIDYTYTAAGPATITSPVNGSTLPGSSVTFQWTTGTGVTQYWLSISKVGAGGGDLFNADPGPGLVTSRTISGLPTDGSTIYVRLYSHIGATWPSRDYVYTAFH